MYEERMFGHEREEERADMGCFGVFWAVGLFTRDDEWDGGRESPLFCLYCLLGSDRLGEVAREVDIDAVHDGEVCAN
jgi:hypothetical protein